MFIKKVISSCSNSKLQKYQLYLTTCGLILVLFLVVYLLSDPLDPDLERRGYGKHDVYKSGFRKPEHLKLQLQQDSFETGRGSGQKGESVYIDEGPSSKYESEKFQLILDHCKIQKVPLTSDSWFRSERAHNDLVCPDGFSFLDQHGTLNINKEFWEDCCYEAIYRPKPKANSSYPAEAFKISSSCLPITNASSQINDEFFRIKCPVNNDSPTFQYEYHAAPKLNKEIKKKIKFWDASVPTVEDRPASVLMLAVDATSRTRFYKSFPKTLGKLEELGFTDFKGHHAQGEPTFPNALPLLMGLPADKFWKLKTKWNTPWDSYPFIWKEFDKQNYITLFMEDEQMYGTFNYGGQTGFKDQPTDVYPRTFIFAKERDKTAHVFGKDKIPCFGNQLMPEYLLSYLNRFMDKTKGIPSFSLSWLTWPQHDYMENLPLLDSPLSNFLDVLSKNREVLENTVIFLFSDHSSWNSPYSETPEGRLERRLPFLFVRYPEKLQKTPEGRTQLDNLRKNQYKLTTHFDTHHTLLQLVDMAATAQGNTTLPIKARGLSLFDKIPRNRTCRKANIGSFICACDLRLPLPRYGYKDSIKSSEEMNSDLKLPSPIINAMPLNRD